MGTFAIVRMSGTKANVQNEAFFADLHVAFDRLEQEFADRAVVLTSGDGLFSAGLDFGSSFERLADRDHQRMAEWISAYQATNLRMWRYPRPTIAAVNGHAFAGGVITALNCDYRVAADQARFSLNEVPIGIGMPAIYIEIIRYATGGPAAALTTLFGQVYTAQESLRVGFVHEVVEPSEVLPRAIEMARAVPPDAFDAYAFSKHALQAEAFERIEGVARSLDRGLPAVLSSDASVRARASRYQEVKGVAPAWARGD